MKPPSAPADCNDEAAGLLPWYVNGTLGREDACRVEAHLQVCAVCRDDAASLEAMRTLLRASMPVEHAPHAGLRKLMARIDADSSDAPAPAGEKAIAAPKADAHRRWPVLRSPVRWLAAAVVAQACAIAALIGGSLLAPSTDAPAPFQTLSSSSPAGPRLRVVFVPDMTLAQLQELLRANQLVAVAGPTEAGIFTLALQAPAVDPQAQAAVAARLRADPRVRFAEPVHGESAPR